jgi:hypothetical protein
MRMCPDKRSVRVLAWVWKGRRVRQEKTVAIKAREKDEGIDIT